MNSSDDAGRRQRSQANIDLGNRRKGNTRRNYDSRKVLDDLYFKAYLPAFMKYSGVANVTLANTTSDDVGIALLLGQTDALYGKNVVPIREFGARFHRLCPDVDLGASAIGM